MTVLQEDVQFLEHFGVKGMKWGVRKDRVRTGDQDISLKSGTKIFNVSSNAPRDIRGPIYSAHTPRDIVNYRGNYAFNLKEFKGADRVFSNSFRVKGGIKAAGRNAQVKAFQELWEKDKDGVARALAEAQKDMKFSAAFNARVLKLDRENVYHRRIMERGEDWVRTKGLQEFNASLAVQTTPGKTKQRDAYFRLMERRGYNAVVDLNDVKQYGSKEPLLIFKGSKSLTKGNSIELTEEHVRKAALAYAHRRKLEKYVGPEH